MRKAAIAEWILSLATTPERAASTVGDLLERPSGFWLSVLRTFASLILDALISSPARIIGWVALTTLAQYPLLLLIQFAWFHAPYRLTDYVIRIVLFFWPALVGHESARFLQARALAAFFAQTVFGALSLLAIWVWRIEGVHVSAIYSLACLAGIVLFRRRHLHRHA
jgi:hypothetical protein